MNEERNGMELVELVENELNVKLPLEYVEFIKKYGTLSTENGEIFGIDKEMEDFEKIPCVIGATKLYRRSYPISDNEIVISFDDLFNEVVVLDTLSGEVYRINQQGKRTLVASNFSEFLRNMQKL